MSWIKNINGTSDTICKCGSWLQHWRNFSEHSYIYCAEKTCHRTDISGAHVQKGGDSTDENWYIMPLCKTHIESTGELEINDTYTFVSADKNETCEK